MLAEVYQRCDRADDAIELLESLGSLSPSAGFAVSLAELYFEREQWGDIIRVTEGFEMNEDDVTAQVQAMIRGCRS